MGFIYNKKNIFAMLSFCFFVVSTSTGASKIEFDKEIIIGKRGENEPKPFFFEVRNTGDEDLVIKTVKSSCGCTSVKVKNSIIKPNSSTIIEGKYIANPNVDEYNIKIIVVSNASNAPNKILMISGRNIPEGFKISPTRVELTSIDGKKPQKQEILLSVNEGTIEVINYSIIKDGEENDENNNIFQVHINSENIEKKENNTLNHIILNLFTNPPLEIGKYKYFLKIDVIVNGERSTYQLPLVLDVVPCFEFIPSSIRLTTINMASELYNYRILIRNREAKNFKIKSIKSSNDAVKISTKETVSGSLYLYFNILKDNELYLNGATISIVLDMDGKEKKMTYNIVPSAVSKELTNIN